MTCLDDIKASIDALTAALDGSLGGGPVTVSTEANAEANASAQAWALATANANAIAVAQAAALALLEIDISVSLSQTTTIVNTTLPPVSPAVPPNVVVFTPADTGVTDTPRDETTPSGTTCQAIYYVIDTLSAVATFLANFPLIGYYSGLALQYILLPAIQAAEFFLQTRGIIVPKGSLAALHAAVMGMTIANLEVRQILLDTAIYLAVERDALAELIFCAYFNGASSWDVAGMIFSSIEGAAGPQVAEITSILFSVNVLGAMIYDSPIFDASDQVELCDFVCGI